MNETERRCERLRNLLSPHFALADAVIHGVNDNDLLEMAKNAKTNEELIRKALDPETTLEELNKLYRV